MNCIEALNEELKKCEPCYLNSFIIEFEQLPEEEKFNFDYYEKDKHFLLRCEKCNTYKLIPEENYKTCVKLKKG